MKKRVFGRKVNSYKNEILSENNSSSAKNDSAEKKLKRGSLFKA